MFTAMKLRCPLAAAADPDPTGVVAADAIAATAGGAEAVGLEGEVGAVAPGMRADPLLLDLRDVAYVPLNSAARRAERAALGAPWLLEANRRVAEYAVGLDGFIPG